MQQSRNHREGVLFNIIKNMLTFLSLLFCPLLFSSLLFSSLLFSSLFFSSLLFSFLLFSSLLFSSLLFSSLLFSSLLFSSPLLNGKNRAASSRLFIHSSILPLTLTPSHSDGWKEFAPAGSIHLHKVGECDAFHTLPRGVWSRPIELIHLDG
jgi:hypothetical protein